jgi:hypothetical protein
MIRSAVFFKKSAVSELGDSGARAGASRKLEVVSSPAILCL